MADWPNVLAPMERAIEDMLGRTSIPDSETAEGAETLLSGAVPLLDELLEPAVRALAGADEQALAAGLHLEDALAALSVWRDHCAALRERLAAPALRAV